jgi:hypothetical protein
MKILMASLLAGLSVYGAAELADTVLPQASAMTATHQGRLISDRAFLESEMGASWEESLQIAVSGARHNDGQLTVTGTVVRWDNGVDVWCIDLPTAESLVEPEKCS